MPSKKKRSKKTEPTELPESIQTIRKKNTKNSRKKKSKKLPVSIQTLRDKQQKKKKSKKPTSFDKDESKYTSKSFDKNGESKDERSKSSFDKDESKYSSFDKDESKFMDIPPNFVQEYGTRLTGRIFDSLSELYASDLFQKLQKQELTKQQALVLTKTADVKMEAFKEDLLRKILAIRTTDEPVLSKSDIVVHINAMATDLFKNFSMNVLDLNETDTNNGLILLLQNIES
jgi:hypothetical protein